MFRTGIVLFLLCVLGIMQLFSMTSADFLTDKKASMRNTAEGSAELIDSMTNELKTSTNSYDIYWQLSAIYYFHGDYYINDRTLKKAFFTQSKDYGLKAVALNPKGVDGHYWLAIAYAKWAESNGILDSLFYADDIVNELTEAINLNPSFLWGLAYAVRAKAYSLAPGWPLSVGNKEYSYRDIQKALEIGPHYRLNMQIYADILRNDGKWKDAVIVMEKALAMPYDERIPKEEDRTISELKRDIGGVRKKAGSN